MLMQEERGSTPLPLSLGMSALLSNRYQRDQFLNVALYVAMFVFIKKLERFEIKIDIKKPDRHTTNNVR
jgi:hypothetical protein